jgi:hypothetical protein
MQLTPVQENRTNEAGASDGMHLGFNPFSTPFQEFPGQSGAE